MELLQQRIWVKWRQFSTGTTNRNILGAALIVGGASALVSLAFIARELLLAATFGSSDALDAFLIAVSIPLFVVSIIGGSFGIAVIPSFIQVREQDGQFAAERMFSGVMALAAGLLIIASVLLALASPIVLPLLASGFDAAKIAFTQRLFYFLLPTILLNGLAAMWSAVLNAGERFALAAFAPAMVPLAAVGALLLGSAWGIQALVLGMIGGSVIQLFLLAWGMTRLGVSLWPRWHGMTPALRQVVGQYVPLVAALALLGSTVLISQAVAATLAPGSVATLSYGMRVVGLVINLGAVALGTAVLPYSSKMVASANWEQVHQTIRTYSRLTLLVTIPITGILYVFSEEIVELVFQRGAFTSADTLLVSRVQSLYALQIPFYVLSIFCGRLLSSLGANHVILWSATISVTVNASLAFFLARALGVAGIALAISLMHIAAFFFLTYMLRRTLRIAAGRSAGDQRQDGLGTSQISDSTRSR